ncbi:MULTISPECIES: hypothetical protein [unclassified Streptomyces]|uniref:hypothetical protein n=1 Tax=unclassified Streptomyces TaxID=2593676 RepID=UPI001654FB88|nr:hypothetical protein [Streptomyces sp. CB02980]MCB8904339.1 hypothetical protein [Streptomyces sp. CB02980]
MAHASAEAHAESGAESMAIVAGTREHQEEIDMAQNMMKGQQNDLSSLMERASKRRATVAFEGYVSDDGNIPGNILVVESDECVYSFAKSDIMDREKVGEERVRVWVRAGAKAFRLSRILAGESQAPFTVAMENIAPPEPVELPGMPRRAGGAPRVEEMEHIAPPRPVEAAGAPRYGADSSLAVVPPALMPLLSSVGSLYTERCVGGDSYTNNCAHFLSDAFIRAGYTELAVANPHINARCGTTARRPVRARDMWSWFQSKAVRTSNRLDPYTGWWAVFQLDESVYWGGHVVLFDSDSWSYYGTGWHGTWHQYLYQW